MLDVREQLAGAAAGRLREVVRAALGERGASPGAWRAEPIGAPVDHAEGSRLYLVSSAGDPPWSVVLKLHPPAADQGDPADIRYREREALLYGSGWLDDLPGGLRAPRCYACDRLDDGTVWLWLEHVREDGPRAWPVARWALAARHLGQLNGAYLAEPARRRPLPDAPWLGGGRLRSWLRHHEPLVARIAAAPDDPGLRGWWPRPVVAAILRLWEERDLFCAALERLPQAFCHGDAIRRNLFARRRADGSEETVAIDWEHAGRMALGEEVGQTLSVAGAFYDLDPDDLPSLDEALFTGYVTGLREAGWRGDESRVRFAFAAHAALRNLFNAVGTVRPDEARLPEIERRFGRTWHELASRRAEVRPFLLERAEEARRRLGRL